MKGSWESYEASKSVGGAENAPPPVQGRVNKDDVKKNEIPTDHYSHEVQC